MSHSSQMIIAGIRVPDSPLARQASDLLRESASNLLFQHSSRVYLWAALTGARRDLKFDPELLYIASMFHDVGLTAAYSASQLRFEVDGANAARDFLKSHGFSDDECNLVWMAVALHTTPGIPQFMRPEVALVAAGAGMDVSGRDYDQFSTAQRDAVVAAFPRCTCFKHRIIDTFYESLKHRPNSTFGTFNDDYIAFKDPNFKRTDVCSVILASAWID